jgi:hypothetical protein
MKALSILILTSLCLAAPQQPLPNLPGFLAEFRKTLHSDGLILSRYTYNMKDTRTRMDSKGNVMQTTTNVYEVFPGVEAWQTQKRLLARNGIPLTAKELEKQDRDLEKNIDSQERKLKKKTPREIEEARAREQREDDEVMQDIFAMYDVRMLRRDVIDGHGAIVLSFTPKPGFKARTGDGRMWHRVAGEVWVSEADHELIRIDAQTIDAVSVSIGLGMLKAPKASRIIVDRRKFNNEVWLPARIEGTVGDGRPTGPRVLRQVVEYLDHKKFSVEIIIRIPGGRD